MVWKALFTVHMAHPIAAKYVVLYHLNIAYPPGQTFQRGSGFCRKIFQLNRHAYIYKVPKKRMWAFLPRELGYPPQGNSFLNYLQRRCLWIYILKSFELRDTANWSWFVSLPTFCCQPLWDTTRAYDVGVTPSSPFSDRYRPLSPYIDQCQSLKPCFNRCRFLGPRLNRSLSLSVPWSRHVSPLNHRLER